MLPPVLRNKRHISPKKKEKKIKSCAIKKCGHTYMVTEEAIFQKHVQKKERTQLMRQPLRCVQLQGNE